MKTKAPGTSVDGGMHAPADEREKSDHENRPRVRERRRGKRRVGRREFNGHLVLTELLDNGLTERLAGNGALHHDTVETYHR